MQAPDARPLPLPPREGVVVPADLRGCHPLVAKTQKGFSEPHDHYYGRRVIKIGELALDVSEEAAPRALRIAEAVIRACEREGWKIDTVELHGEVKTRVIVNGTPVRISMKEVRKRAKAGGSRRAHSGLLEFEIDEHVPRLLRLWADSKTQVLENVLGEIIPAINKAAEHVGEELRIEAEKRRQREELRARIETEKQRRQELETQAMSLEKARVIRGLIDAVKSRCADDPANAQRWAQWIAWAEARAALCDPFLNGYLDRALDYSALHPELDCNQQVSMW